MADARPAAEESPRLALRPSPMRPSAFGVRRNRKNCKPNAKSPGAGARAWMTFQNVSRLEPDVVHFGR